MEDVFRAIWHWFANLTTSEFITLISAIVAWVFSPLLVYWIKQTKIPKLVFDGVWKNNDKVIPTAIIYFLKVKREKGEGGLQGFRGFVGVKDKFEPKRSELLSKNSEIFLHDYLVLFKMFEYNANKVITFPGIEYSSNPDAPPSFENAIYNDYKECEVVVNVDSFRGRIRKKQFTEKIDNIVNKAKQIPS